MIPMKDECMVLAGAGQPETIPWEPFAEPVMEFLGQLSLKIRRERQQYEELAAFGFWCRRSHLEEFKNRYKDGRPRLGRGKVFHIPASNVPLLFAYSLVMGLLAGNSCLVRLSFGIQEQDRVLCGIMDELLSHPGHQDVRKRISVFSCRRESPRVSEEIGACDGLVVWGGDQTVREIRSMPMRPDAVQLCFPDRYSICILDTASMSAMGEEEWNSLVHRFYNDTYVFDQNACVSPGCIIWNQRGETKEAEDVRNRWWNAVAEKALSYPLTPRKATVKYEQLCRYAMTSEGGAKITCYGNRLYTVLLPRIPEHPARLQGRFGLFFEYRGDWREGVKALATGRLQTVTCHGIKEQDLVDFVLKNRIPGVHRIAAVGRAGEMDLIWDGQDVIAMLSRQIGREAQNVCV